MCKKLLNLFFILLFVTVISCIPAFAANGTVSDDTITFTTSRAVGENIKLNIKASDNIEISGIAETTNLTGPNTFTLTSQTVVIKGPVTTFECPDNGITSLDVSKNKKLSILKCECNLLDSLDLSQNPAIIYVKCYGNRIKNEDLTQMMESLPQDIIIEFDKSYVE